MISGCLMAVPKARGCSWLHQANPAWSARCGFRELLPGCHVPRATLLAFESLGDHIRARIFSPRGASDQTCREHGQHVCLDPHHIIGAIFASCQRRQSFVVLLARQNTRLSASRHRRLTTNNSFALVAAVPFAIERASSRSGISESLTGGGCIA